MSEPASAMTSCGVPCGDHLAAVLAGARPHVDDVVGRAHGLLVVLDDDHRVAEVAQAQQRVDEAAVVALVQADAGLVEDVEHADERRADLRGEADALRLAAGERGRGALQREVADADVVQEAQALADLLDHAAADEALGVAERQVARGTPSASRTLSSVNSWMLRSPTVTARLVGLSRAPLHSGHGRSAMYSSIFWRTCSDSVSVKRRCRCLMMPGKLEL